MPVRNSGGSSNGQTRTGSRTAGPAQPASANTRMASRQQNQFSEPEPSEDDVWDEIENMKGSGEDGGFNKMNTNMWLKDGDECEVVLLDGQPKVFWAHSIKCKSQNGKVFFRQEACQKTTGQTCLMCDSSNPAISKARKVIGFPLLDGRGTYNTKTNAFDYVPIPKIFLTPLYLAKQIKVLKDDLGGDITSVVLKLNKSDRYMITFALEKLGNGQLSYIEAPQYDGEVPEIMEVYKPLDDRDLIEFIQQFADTTGAGMQAQSNAAPSGFSGNRQPPQPAPAQRGRFGGR